LKIKAAQDISTAEAKVNERNIQANEDELKSSLHSDLLIRIIEDSYSYKQENVNKITQS
jgi:chorismate mutase